ncbi:hypothetical protein [Streptomyces griseomycini]|uniref:Uncharacterized protein n=1 Tax=Streptomyces griseomycini TaxID=66895 RepID=A0A7W7PWH0_9ACTN|nr:hypothetical protein [Streptomyces griseomycini]MBB4902501.1 hypothetical protein [Streptomyces griseomycini]GGR52071.1 hypothetical protein GCM10015536_66930 [Streptomyces griseomycini]
MPALPVPLSVISALAREPSLLPRVRMAIAVVAQEVFAEDPATPGHTMRWNFSKTVLYPTDVQAAATLVGLVASQPMLDAVAATGATDAPSIAAALTDEQLLDAIRQGWNTSAGVSPAMAQPGTPLQEET